MQLEQTQSVEHTPILRFVDESERMEHQFQILEAVARILELGGWSGHDAGRYLQSIFMESGHGSIGERLHDLTQNTDPKVIEEIEHFIHESTEWRKDDPPVTVPAVLAFLIPKEGKVKDEQPTLH